MLSSYASHLTPGERKRVRLGAALGPGSVRHSIVAFVRVLLE